MITARVVFVACVAALLWSPSIAAASSITFTDADGVLSVSFEGERVTGTNCSFESCQADFLPATFGAWLNPQFGRVSIAQSDNVAMVAYVIDYGYLPNPLPGLARITFWRASPGTTCAGVVGGCSLIETGARQLGTHIYWDNYQDDRFDSVYFQGDLPDSASAVPEPGAVSVVAAGVAALLAIGRKHASARSIESGHEVHS